MGGSPQTLYDSRRSLRSDIALTLSVDEHHAITRFIAALSGAAAAAHDPLQITTADTPRSSVPEQKAR